MIHIQHPSQLEYKTTIEQYYQHSSIDFDFIFGEPHKVIFQNQSFSLNFKDREHQQLITKKHPLLSAITKQPSKILDAFGGLGKDGFILAHQHHTVITHEINPILFLLLSQALERYQSPLNWSIHYGDVTTSLIADTYDIIYLDPMFDQDRTAKPKLPMQVIQKLSLDQPFTDWEKAYHVAKKRLVIKQHLKSPPNYHLPKPSLQIKGKRNVRYDVYLKKTS